MSANTITLCRALALAFVACGCSLCACARSGPTRPSRADLSLSLLVAAYDPPLLLLLHHNSNHIANANVNANANANTSKASQQPAPPTSTKRTMTYQHMILQAITELGAPASRWVSLHTHSAPRSTPRCAARYVSSSRRPSVHSYVEENYEGEFRNHHFKSALNSLLESACVLACFACVARPSRT